MATLCNIYKFYHAAHKNGAVTCSKIESILFCCVLQQHFFTIFCRTARKNIYGTRCNFFMRMQCNKLHCMRTKKLHRGALPYRTPPFADSHNSLFLHDSPAIRSVILHFAPLRKELVFCFFRRAL